EIAAAEAMPAEAAPAEAAPAEAAPAAPAPGAALPELPAGSGDIANTPPAVAAEPAPAEAAAPAAEAEAPAAEAMAGESHVVAPGDSLWNISLKYYGTGTKWKMIADANPDANPDDLKIGSTLKIPPAG
ncbi:MAG: LysM peptidoglycan-binding domain-containing protein, partial [Alphaproteobacteria bacterium]|nr:LysM peptidoglycan-binding domain-containing protein [Alphaproteobacteria bacterium]